MLIFFGKLRMRQRKWIKIVKKKTDFIIDILWWNVYDDFQQAKIKNEDNNKITSNLHRETVQIPYSVYIWVLVIFAYVLF